MSGIRITAADYFGDVAKARLCDAILAVAGVDPGVVPELTIDTDRGVAIIERFALDESGSKYLVDAEGGKAVAGNWRDSDRQSGVIAKDTPVEVPWPHGLNLPPEGEAE